MSAAVALISAVGLGHLELPTQAIQPGGYGAANSFSRLLMDGITKVDEKLVHADQVVKAYAIDDSIPVHQVTYALEEARLALELMMQVRARLVDSYQEIMRMQL